METVLGIKAVDGVLLACDTIQAKNWLVMRDDSPKIHHLSKNTMLAIIGDAGDSLQFTDFISKNLQLYNITNGYPLSPRAAAHFTRRNLADYVRSRTVYQVSLLLAGYDEIEGPALFYVDSLGTAKALNYAGHGMGSLLCGSIFQSSWFKSISQQQAFGLLQKCVTEVQKRLFFNLRNFNVYLVDKNGIRQIDQIVPNYNRQLTQ